MFGVTVKIVTAGQAVFHQTHTQKSLDDDVQILPHPSSPITKFIEEYKSPMKQKKESWVIRTAYFFRKEKFTIFSLLIWNGFDERNNLMLGDIILDKWWSCHISVAGIEWFGLWERQILNVFGFRFALWKYIENIFFSVLRFEIVRLNQTLNTCGSKASEKMWRFSPIKLLDVFGTRWLKEHNIFRFKWIKRVWSESFARNGLWSEKVEVLGWQIKSVKNKKV